jgi:hypothetical protein
MIGRFYFASLMYCICMMMLQDDAPPLEDDETKEKRTDDISSWDADFLKVEQSTLFELILVSKQTAVNL